jgi:uncharacterized integral membrane protein
MASDRTKNPGRIVTQWAALLIMVLVIAVALQNAEPVETRVLFTTVTVPLVALLLLTLVVGFGAGFLTTWLALRDHG